MENQISESANTENSLQCPDCRKTYSSKSNLKIHIGKKHPSLKTPQNKELKQSNVEEKSTNSDYETKFLTETGLEIHIGKKHQSHKEPDGELKYHKSALESSEIRGFC